MTRTRTLGSVLWLGLVSFVLVGSAARADLFDYVKRPDPAFAWRVEQNHDTPLGKATRLRLTSQVWQGGPWEHRLEVYEPAGVKPGDTMLLFITGGSSTSQPKPADDAQGFGLAQLCGAPCAVLHQVPNQPLLGGRKEDDLIAETFMRYLDTKDPSLPLLFPMVKSAVKAMDALQAWARDNGRPEPKRFIVSGASKRGWTTWLTGASDSRVIGIAPMVIVTLNMKAQNPHQLEVWGRYSEQIEDYTRRGLTERINTPDGEKLWRMIDPYSYLDRLTMPKLLINGTNDRYWTLDALNLYWDDLKGPKFVTYVPNAGHGLDKNRDYATHALGAFFRATASARPLPNLDWKHETQGDRLRLTVGASPSPKNAQIWIARSDSKDFRESPWTASPMKQEGDQLVAEVPRPDSGYVALFGDLEYQIDDLGYHLSTQIN